LYIYKFYFILPSQLMTFSLILYFISKINDKILSQFLSSVKLYETNLKYIYV